MNNDFKRTHEKTGIEWETCTDFRKEAVEDAKKKNVLPIKMRNKRDAQKVLSSTRATQEIIKTFRMRAAALTLRKRLILHYTGMST